MIVNISKRKTYVVLLLTEALLKLYLMFERKLKDRMRSMQFHKIINSKRYYEYNSYRDNNFILKIGAVSPNAQIPTII